MRSRGATALAAVALVFGTAALALSAWTFWQSRTPSYDDAARTAAGDAVCTAYATVRTGVATNTHLRSPGGDADVTGVLATAANARVALLGGGQYLLSTIGPATPPELASAAEDFAHTLMRFGAAAMAGAPEDDPAQQALEREIDDLNGRVQELCG
ncbi:hypothetical protein [Mycobacterium sp. PS03-16]|uniref:hypothetical protein n=1 Tax=Mycobacterium sp. PS03-16 TaxID=2559611 RepID=UPI001FD75D6C|nr:hypothetical protein [Mycobacterium sp. PS03-16]